MDFKLNLLGPGEVETYQTHIVEIYRQAFAPPPYSKTKADAYSFASTLLRHSQRTGFRLAAAWGLENGQVLGFAYGYFCAPGQWWRDNVAQALGPAQTERWLSTGFEFVELAVLPDAQGQGLGSRLHDLLLNDLTNPTAVLSTLNAETAGLHLYRKRGWKVLLPELFFPGNSKPYQIMGLDLQAYLRAVRMPSPQTKGGT